MRRGSDDALDADTDDHDTEVHRKVSITPDVKPYRVTMRAHALFAPGRVVEVPPADQEGYAHAQDRGERRLRRPVLLALQPWHERDDRLAEQNQREQAEALGKMRRIRWRLDAVRHGDPRRPEIDCERGRPHPQARRYRHQRGRQPEHGRRAMPGDV